MKAEEREVEELAETLSWTSGEFMRWQDDAHPDHNRWSWQGDGHGSAMRDEFRDQARALLASPWLAAVVEGARRDGKAEGAVEFAEWVAINRAYNGDRAARIAGGGES